VELHTEVTEIQRGIGGRVPLIEQHHRDRIAKKSRLADGPLSGSARAVTFYREEAFARSNQYSIAHCLPPFLYGLLI
jgi:hypothetical protein